MKIQGLVKKICKRDGTGKKKKGDIRKEKEGKREIGKKKRS